MAPSKQDCLKVIEVLSEKEQLNATVGGSAKAAAFTAVCTFAGGVLGGPLGLFVGGTLGSLSSAKYSQGKFKSVMRVINEDMTREQRQRLSGAVSKVLNSVTAKDVTAVMLILSTNQSLKAAVINEIGTFLKNEMYMSIV
ncbi:unnamed protein product [Brassicogethes aeneus]|uniref:Uncharacterized protein n=1 Tax=Brassicogethes aeneus TaxID=1431903 RepID=A0A9P0FDQ1_BRAAE|nr:unnamed protein product [Brassicogethes aeneus]